MEKVRIMTLGGLDEDGRNMTLVEINDQIIIIDAGLKYPENNVLGVEMIIPNFHYLVENKDKILGIFITHAHDDVMGALPYLIKEINIPIYTAPFTAIVIDSILKSHGLKGYKVHRIKRYGNLVIGKLKVITFGLTHSIADTFGLAISTEQGYIVHASEYIIDFDISESSPYDCDITEFADLGKKNVLMLMTESKSSDRPGFTSPRHRIASQLERYIENSEGRVIVTLYEQNLFRLMEVIDLAVKHKRKLYFANENQRQYLNNLSQLKYYQFPVGMEIRNPSFNNDIDDVIIVVSEQGPKVFRLMHTIATGDHSSIRLREGDTVVICSPVVPGAERDASKMEDELYKDGVHVATLNREDVLTMHPSTEDLKMMLQLLKPSYYIPLKGDYRQLVNNATLALNRGYYADHIIVLDNGQVASFEDGKFKSMSEFVNIEEVLIDGNESLDSSGLVLRDRESLATDGAIIIGIVIDFQTKEVLGGPDVQSRGVIYLKDADYVVKECGKIMEQVIMKQVQENRYENMAARTEAKEQMVKYVQKMTGKRPMILPVIIEINP